MSVSAMRSLDQIKKQLREEKELGDHVKADLYSHLTEVFSRIIQYHNDDAFDKFEEISNMVKATNLKVSDPKHDYQINGNNGAVTNQYVLDLIEKFKNLLKEMPDTGISIGDKALLSKNQKYYMPNLQEQASMLEWAGVNFGEDITYMLQKSMKRLAVLSGATKLNFFGKVYGTVKDYWVVSGVLPYVEEAPKNPDQEPRGTGVNTYVYWVTDDLLGDWIQLPECQPEHLVAARSLKHVFSGNLNALIDSCPPFPGKERHLLRATVARITHATELCFKGTFDFTEDEVPVQKYAEEQPAFQATDLQTGENWSHLHSAILLSGRTTHAPTEDEELKAKQEAEDPVAERFRDLTQDTPIVKPPADSEEGGLGAWVFRLSGDAQPYSKGEGTAIYACAVVKSLRWPGAITVAKGGKAPCTIYVGDGIKKGDFSYNPTEPPEVQEDPLDQVEMPEPTPLVAPAEPPEPDTDGPLPGQEQEDA